MGNLLLDEHAEHIVISDFGIAGMRDATTTTTTTGDGSGSDTPGGGSAQYMSPEQYDPDEFHSDSEEEEAVDAQVKSAGTAAATKVRVDKRPPVDVWAWACVMLEMLSGRKPWPNCSSDLPF